MIVCGDRHDFRFCEKIAKSIDANIFFPEITTFADGEMKISVHNSLVGQDVLLIKLFGSGDINIEVLKTSFAIDALKRAGAKKITAFLPYFPYVRSDHQKKSGEAVNLEVIAKLFEGSGINRIITIDPHTVKFPEFFTIPISILSTTGLYAAEIGKTIKNRPFSLVSPDSGGLRLIQPLAEIFRHAKIATISKERFGDGSVVANEVEGEVEEICVIVDDIISTGGTIIEAIRILKKHGGHEFHIFATHGVFAKSAGAILNDPSIKSIHITDSVLFEKKEFNNVKILPVHDLVVSHMLTP